VARHSSIPTICAGLCAGAEDSSAYYAIGFHSANPARDGKFRKLTIKVNRPGVKIEYRPGYYAPRTSRTQARKTASRSLRADGQRSAGHRHGVYMDAFYFRLDQNRYFVPVSLIVPGSQIPFVKGRRQGQGHAGYCGRRAGRCEAADGQARETVKLNLDAGLNARQKNIQYTTSFNLPPGKYR